MRRYASASCTGEINDSISIWSCRKSDDDDAADGWQPAQSHVRDVDDDDDDIELTSEARGYKMLRRRRDTTNLLVPISTMRCKASSPCTTQHECLTRNLETTLHDNGGVGGKLEAIGSLAHSLESRFGVF